MNWYVLGGILSAVGSVFGITLYLTMRPEIAKDIIDDIEPSDVGLVFTFWVIAILAWPLGVTILAGYGVGKLLTASKKREEENEQQRESSGLTL